MRNRLFFSLLLFVTILVSVTILASAEKSGDYEYEILDDGSTVIVKYYGDSSKLAIPSKLDGHEVTGIGDGAFYHCDNLTSVKIPKCVITIGDNPFAFCGNLKKITVSRGQTALTVVDGVLFSKADKRLVCFPCALKKTKYTIPKWVEIIGNRAFYYCDQLKQITIPDSVTIIGDEAFVYCSFSRVKIPESATAIGDRAFWGCDGLTEITLPDSIVHIGKNPFGYCTNLTSIRVSPMQSAFCVIDGVLISNADKRLVCYPCTLANAEYQVPREIKIIGDDAFINCRKLTTVILPYGVTSIGNSAFSSCVNLTDITIPDSVNTIGEQAFRACNSLTSIAIPYGTACIMDYSFSECFSLTNVIIPNSVSSIGTKAFSECRNLTSVIIPGSVFSIGERAFSGCYKLTSVTIPSSVTHIAPEAFVIYERGNDRPNMSIVFSVSRGSYAEQYCMGFGFQCIYLDAIIEP